MKARKLRKIQLVNSPLPNGTKGVGNVECFPPTGLLSLATYLKEFKDIEVEILDGGILGLSKTLSKLDADLVAANALGPTYESTLSILDTAKSRGALTLMGGHHTYHLAKEILKNRPFVDFIIRGDNAEWGFLEFIRFLEGDIPSPHEVPSLAFRDSERIVINPLEQLALDRIPPVDLSLVNLQDYFDNYNSHFGEWHPDGSYVKNAVTKNAQGCKRGDNGRCMYCNIPDMSFRFKDTQRFWSEIEYINQKFGINFVFETADSLASFLKIEYMDSNYLEELAKARPPQLDTELFVFARAEEISPKVIDLFQQLRVKRVNMGLDSGDDLMLRSGIRKGNTSLETNWNAVHLLAKAGIQMYISIVLGGIGESEGSLQNTLNFAKELLDYDHIVVVDPSPLLPLPGSPSWRFVGEKYSGQDLFDTEEVARLWVNQMCNVHFEELKAVDYEIQEMAKNKGKVVGGYGIKNV